jgi:hypothetical protein
MRLNLGCGEDIRPGYLNVDLKKRDGVDLVANVLTLSFPPQSFTDIFMGDIIEHLYLPQAGKLLRNCYEWLKPQGTLMIHGPNLPFLANKLADGGDYNDLVHFEALKWLYGITPAGESDSPFMIHYWNYSKESLSHLLREVGFRIATTEIDCGGFGLYVAAFKP